MQNPLVSERTARFSTSVSTTDLVHMVLLKNILRGNHLETFQLRLICFNFDTEEDLCFREEWREGQTVKWWLATMCMTPVWNQCDEDAVCVKWLRQLVILDVCKLNRCLFRLEWIQKMNALSACCGSHHCGGFLLLKKVWQRKYFTTTSLYSAS